MTEQKRNIGPAAALLKTNPELIAQSPEIARQLIADKGFAGEAIARLGGRRMRLLLEGSAAVHRRAMMPISGLSRVDTVVPQYTGTHEENTRIDEGIKTGRKAVINGGKDREKAEVGAIDTLRLPEFKVPAQIADTPIIIIGGGAAGIISGRSLHEMGFTNVKIFEKGKPNGIWNADNADITDGSRNNPSKIVFHHRHRTSSSIPPVPGSGREITSFLDDMTKGPLLSQELNIRTAEVTHIQPGDLHHIVHYQTPEGEARAASAPIVINATGVGEPLPANLPGTMETSTKDAGVRWQEKITPQMAEEYRNKSMVLIGLGNSTAEMLMQIQAYNAQGYNIGYKILTHYPQEAVVDPTSTYNLEGRHFKVFRDSRNLGRYDGDLQEPRDAYVQAVQGGKVMADVTRWDRIGDNVMVEMRDGSSQIIPCDRLYTLIGYGQPVEVLEKMGMTVTDADKRTVAVDYDGEVQRVPGVAGRDRVFPGYFASGSVLKSSTMPNASVIPGIFFRTPDLLLAVTTRAMEYQIAIEKYKKTEIAAKLYGQQPKPENRAGAHRATDSETMLDGVVAQWITSEQSIQESLHDSEPEPVVPEEEISEQSKEEIVFTSGIQISDGKLVFGPLPGLDDRVSWDIEAGPEDQDPPKKTL